MKNIREKLGLSQNEMGSLLGMHRSTAAMYEIGSRDLNKSQLALLSRIEILLQDEPEIKPFEKIRIKAHTNKVSMTKKMEQHLEKAAFDCEKLKRKLNALIDDFAKTETLWSIVSRLKAETAENTQLMAYLNLLEIRCLENVDRYGPHQQAEMAFRIKMLQQEQEVLQGIIDGAVEEGWGFGEG